MEKELGKIIHYYDKAGVAVVKLTGGALKVGDKVKLVKGDQEYTETVGSLQVEHESVQSVKKGDEVAVKVFAPIKSGAKIYKVE